MKSNKSMFVLALTLVAVPVVASTTWYVDGVQGSDNNSCESRQHACKTIGHAISLASTGDSIRVAPATYAENFAVNFSLKIAGANAKTTIIDGDGVNTVVTILNANAKVALSNLTVRNGGQGIYNKATLAVSNSTINSNNGGGGIYNDGWLTMRNSTISENVAKGSCCTGGLGGGIFANGGTLTIINSTIGKNLAMAGRGHPSYGGGIYNYGSLTISNSSVSGNIASKAGGIQNYLTASLKNSIVANNIGGNCGGSMTSDGYNLTSDNSCNLNGPGDINNTDPKLGTLGNYGGQTQTIPLLEGSPAIDAGNPNGCTDGNGKLLKTDQRGKPRPDKEDETGCDMGAYERQSD
jgi:hypothetical protein